MQREGARCPVSFGVSLERKESFPFVFATSFLLVKPRPAGRDRLPRGDFAFDQQEALEIDAIYAAALTALQRFDQDLRQELNNAFYSLGDVIHQH